MAVSGVLKEAGKSAIGKVAKAVIEIYDERVKEVDVVEMGGGFAAKNRLTGIIKLTDKAGLGDVVGEIKDSLLGVDGTRKKFIVRFNPSQLTLKAQGGGRVAKTNFAENGNSKIEYTSMTPRIQLGVDLIFDDVSRSDAFMSEKLSVAGLGKTALDALRKKTHTIQPQVEGFIAALRSPYTRRVSFNWGNMFYDGLLNYLDAEYTMFSISGRPIRAVVHMGILCVDETINDGDMGWWGEYFNSAFGVSSSTNLVTAGQKVGNLLNINL